MKGRKVSLNRTYFHAWLHEGVSVVSDAVHGAEPPQCSRAKLRPNPGYQERLCFPLPGILKHGRKRRDRKAINSVCGDGHVHRSRQHRAWAGRLALWQAFLKSSLLARKTQRSFPKLSVTKYRAAQAQKMHLLKDWKLYKLKIKSQLVQVGESEPVEHKWHFEVQCTHGVSASVLYLRKMMRFAFGHKTHSTVDLHVSM